MQNRFNQITWSTAISSANGLASGTCGITDGSKAGDWRLPNVLELRTLGNAGQADLSAWLITQGFTNVQKNVYWASTTLANDTTSALTLDMTIGSGDSGAKTGASFVWPVRDTQ